jgi:ectoine hydroxylase-related dioxygenase (phytanoyl-CoA dioxygenase family)
MRDRRGVREAAAAGSGAATYAVAMDEIRVPIADASRSAALSPAEAAAFRAAGALIVRKLIGRDELDALREQTLALVVRAAAERIPDMDFQYKGHPDGREVPFRVEYVVDKLPACRGLLGHPFVLRSVELLQGRDFIPTWDSMVFKLAGAGAAIEWHRDADSGQCESARPIFNVDFYLDGSDASNCLWAIPGSNHWSDAEAERVSAARNAGGFSTEGACALPLEPGDALLHDILLVHGSPATRGGLRRVLYYEFRPAELELRLGPHTASYVPAKRRVLASCLRERAAAPWAHGETAYRYQPERGGSEAMADVHLASHRVPHHEHWRWDLERARAEARTERGAARSESKGG